MCARGTDSGYYPRSHLRVASISFSLQNTVFAIGLKIGGERGTGYFDLPESFAISLSRSSFSVGIVLIPGSTPALVDSLDGQN